MSLLASRLLHRHASNQDDGPDFGAIPPVEEGGELVDGFRVIRHIRRGGACDIYEVWSLERHCACVAKVVRPDRDEETRVLNSMRREGETLLSCTHPHIVRAYGLYDEPRLTLILEMLEGATVDYLVHQHWRRITPEGMSALGLHLCSAIGYLHRHGLLHLDLKPTNVISDAGRAVIIDLNLAQPPGPVHTGVGTAEYLSPEQARGGIATAATDIWGIGAVLFEVATRHAPFPESRHAPSFGQLNRRVTLEGHSRNRLPGVLATAINGCLDPNPDARPRLDELEATLDQLSE